MRGEFTTGHFGQIHRYTHIDGEKYVDFIGKLENIEGDVEELSKLVNIKLDLSAEHKHAQTVSSQVYPHYSAAYDSEMVEMVEQLYEDDLNLFGYEFERQCEFSPPIRE